MRAVRAVDAQTVTWARKAGDLVARDRMATSGELHGRALISLDLHGREFPFGFNGLVALRKVHKAAQHCGGKFLAEPDVGVERRKAFGIHLLLCEAAPDVLGNFVKANVVFLGGLFQRDAAEPHGVFKLTIAKELPHFGAGASGVDVVEPGGRGTGVRIRHDFDDVAVLKRRFERTRFAVDLRGFSVVAHVRVNLVGKVNRARAARKRHDAALRGKDVDAVGEEVDLDVVEELGTVLARTLNFKEALQPRRSAGLHVVRVGVLMVEPVREDAVFVDAVHFFRTDLVLNGRPDHGRVQTLIAVCLWDRNEVLEAVMDGLVEGMQGPERTVAVFLRAHDHAETVYGERFGEGLMIFAHLVVDAVDRLVAADDAGADAVLRKNFLRFGEDLFENRAAVVAAQKNVFVEDPIAEGITVCKGEFLEFPEDLVETEPVRNRHVDVERFLPDAGALFGAHDAQGAHVVETVGKLYENHADVPRHGEEHLAKALGLGDFVGGEAKFVEFRYAVHKFRHLNAEALGHLLLAQRRVFKDVVHEARLNRGGVELPGGENRRDRDRVRDVGFARFAELSKMCAVGVAVGFADLGDFGFRHVLLAALDQVACRSERRHGLRGKERQVRVRHLV